ncbi:MAG: SMP-30/gluconolactonase/LRE family protein [bacterium]|nr:SMP-30/gluconolactonase/LRE family protein [bacterium]
MIQLRPRDLPSLLALISTAITSATAQVEIHDPRGRELVVADAKIERLGAGMKFVEGPVWLPNERALVFSDIPRGKLMRWTAATGVAEWRDSEQSNGNTLDREGRLLSCEHRARRIVRYGADGEPTVLLERFDGKRLNSPNDLAVRFDGSIWFTDPPYGLRGRAPEQPGNFVYRLEPKTGAVTVMQREFDKPNGICFAPDHVRIYIADSGEKQRVGAFAVQADGALSRPLFWLAGGADGMRCDRAGNLWRTTRSGVLVHSPRGELLATIRLPEVPANCAFGGADGKSLFVTARTSLYRVPVQITGAACPPR